VAFSPDGQTLAVASGLHDQLKPATRDDDTVRLWDVATGKARATLIGTGPVLSVAFSPDGQTLAAASGDDNTVRLWDVASEKTRTTLTGHTGAVLSVAFSPDGRSLATGSSDHTARLWNAPPLDPAALINKICQAVGRGLTPHERATYLPPDQPATACAP
jgi:WD40 repeat protein